MPNDDSSAGVPRLHARSAGTAAAPLDLATAGAPTVLHWPGRRLVVQHGDAELAVLDLDGDGTPVLFPAPWPRRYGSATVSPAGDVAVFAGTHALRAVDASGATLWEFPHGCWSATTCEEEHASFDEYADNDDHEYLDAGSAAFSPDGALLWAHVRNHADGDVREEWVVLDAADGTPLGRADTMTVGAASYHFPHPDPASMGMSVAQGEEDSPVLWGRWDGADLTVQSFVDEVLLDVVPSGERFLTTDTGQWSLYLNGVAEGAELRRLDFGDVPSELFRGDEDRARWDFEAAVPFEGLAVAGTEHHADGSRHWLVDLEKMAVSGRIVYPEPVSGPPRPAGEGAWHTLSGDRRTLRLWTLPDAD